MPLDWPVCRCCWVIGKGLLHSGKVDATPLSSRWQRAAASCWHYGKPLPRICKAPKAAGTTDRLCWQALLLILRLHHDGVHQVANRWPLCLDSPQVLRQEHRISHGRQ